MLRLCLSLVLVFLSFVNAAEVHASAKQIVFTPLVHDFGVIQQGQPLKIVFQFQNTSQKPLVIEGVHLGCGCMTALDIVGHTFAPGEKGSVEVDFDSSRFLGNISKSVVVISQADVLYSSHLTIKGKVESNIRIDPPVVLFDDGHFKKGEAALVSLQSASNFTLEVKAVRYNTELLSVRQEQVKPGHYLLHVSPVKKDHSVVLRESILVESNHPYQKEIRILVRNRHPVVEIPQLAKSGYLEFGMVVADQEIERRLDVASLNPRDVLIDELYIDGEAVVEEWATILHYALEEKSKTLKLSLRHPGEKISARGPVRGTVKIRDAEEKITRFPIYGYFL